HAIGRVGDYLLENDQIRLIIADVGPGRVNLPFGGSLVDADLVRPGGAGHGNDQLAELLPGFMFVGLNPTSVTITHDGSDGYEDGLAEVDVTGNGDDLLQMIGLLDAGLVFPSGLQLTQAYRLHPGKRYVEIVTTVTNTSSGAHPFPYLNPSQLAATGLGNIPDIGTLQLSVPMGQLPLLGGEQDLFVPGVAGFNVHFAITDAYALAKGFPSFPGMVVDFLASRGKGVSYGLTVLPSPTNYVNMYASGYSNQTVTPYSMLIPFTYAGVSAVYSNEPPEQLNAGESYSFTSYFVVGKGDVGSVLDTIYELRGTATGTFGGQVIDSQTSAALGSANVIINDGSGNPIDQLYTDAGGAFLGHLAPGNYSYQIVADDHLTTQPVAFTVAAGAQTGELIQVDPPGTIAVSVVDELGRHAPCKVLLVGHFDDSHLGQDPRTFLYSFKLGEKQRTTAFDPTSDAFVEGAWWTKDGRLEGTVRPGTYDLIVSRGPEYELHTETVTIKPGGFAESEIQLVRSFPTDGWIAADFHLHAQASTDSGLPNDQRVISAAAEGLDVATATDHNFVTDYEPTIGAQALDTWLLGISGLELTTFEMGHFIGFPLKVDPGSTRGGEFVWAGQPPQKLFDQLHNDLALVPGQSIVDIAHPRQQVLGYFAQFFVDAATAAPYTPTGILGVFAPYGSEFQPQNFSYDFDALEVITNNHYEDIHSFVAPDPADACGSAAVPGQVVLGPDGRPTFPGVVETWFTMLDHGLMPTALGASDSHKLLGDEPGYARTLVYVGAGKDVAGAFGRDDVVNAIKAHHAVATNAPMIEMTIANGMIGDTVTASGQVTVNVHVRAPSWAQVDHVKLYQGNGGAVVADLA
ncbi:MAG TPA: CehA/McbA family metallohydrolase, partial [Acidimicrobiia bacterium]